MDCLIVKPKWLNLILDGKKDLEIRGSLTNKRGRIGLIESGSGEIKGFVDIVCSYPIDRDLFEANRSRHCIDAEYDKLPYQKPCAWVFQNPVRFKKPIKYKHPQGAVIWVKVEDFNVNYYNQYLDLLY